MCEREGEIVCVYVGGGGRVYVYTLKVALAIQL